MNCHKVSSLTSAYIDGELTGVEMLEIRRHLDHCHACMLQYESLRYTKQLLARLTYVEPRPGLAASICAKLDEIEVPRYQRVWHKFWGNHKTHVTPIAVGCTAMGAMLMFMLPYSVKQPDVVAFHRQPLSAGTLGLPTTTASAIPANYALVDPGTSRTLVADTIPSGSSSSGIIIPASFEGP